MNWRNVTLNKIVNPNSYYRVANYLKERWLGEKSFEAVEEEAVRYYPGFGENAKIRILYVALTYDYNEKFRGFGFEENNFFNSLFHMGFSIVKFDFGSIAKKYGRTAMNLMLVDVAHRYRPDVMFSCLFTDEIDPTAIGTITHDLGIKTVNWFADDHWRFDNFTTKWLSVYSHAITTDEASIEKYHAAGFQNVIYSQWACNPFLYRPQTKKKLYDVTFIGQPHGDRRSIVERLNKEGINVDLWGLGWGHGRVSQVDMIKIFNQSKINLNLSNSSAMNRAQIKGRDFEIPGTGSFMLTQYSEELSRYYVPGEEVAMYSDLDELIVKIKYYLGNETARNAIQDAGYQRTLHEHTYPQRFRQIFATMKVIGERE